MGWEQFRTDSDSDRHISAKSAIFDYRQIIEQIKIAKKQEDRADEQRKFESKIQSLNMLLIALDKNVLKINNLQKILELS